MTCDLRRAQILEAALRRFDHYGFRKTTMAEIAKEAGVSVGALYLFFKSKEEILLANAERRYYQYMASMREVVAEQSPPPEKLEKLTRVRVLHMNRLCSSSPHAGELVRLLKERFQDHHQVLLRQEITLLEEVLREGVEAGVFQVKDLEKTAECMHMAYAAFLPPLSDGKSEAQLAQGVSGMTWLILSGVLVRRR